MTTSLLRRFTYATTALNGRRAGLAGRGDAGMTTAEYAVGTLAACAFAALLFVVVKDGTVRKAILDVIVAALNSKG